MSQVQSKIERALSGAERVLKTDISYLLRGGSWLALGQLVASSSALVLGILFANLLPKETYGMYKYVLSIASILGITTLIGINTTLAQGIARGYEGSLKAALYSKIRWGVIGGFAGMAIAIYYDFQGNLTLALAIAIASLFVPMMDPLGLYTIYLQSKKMFREAITYFIINQIVSSVSLAITLLLTDNLFVLLLAYFVPWTLMRYFFHHRTLAKYPPNDKEDPSIISRGKHLSFVGVITNVATYFDSLIIFHFLGAAPVALYGIAIAPVEQLRAIYKNIPALALPRLSNRTIPEINVLLYRRLIYLFLFGLLTASAYALAAPAIFSVLFPKYRDAVLISQLFAFTLSFKLAGTFFGAVTQSKVDLIPKRWYYWGSMPQIALVISMWTLTPLFGLLGVVAAKFIEQLVGFIVGLVIWIFLSKHHA